MALHVGSCCTVHAELSLTRRRGRCRTWSRAGPRRAGRAIARPTSTSLCPAPYTFAVSRNVTPRSSARWIVAIDSSQSPAPYTGSCPCSRDPAPTPSGLRVTPYAWLSTVIVQFQRPRLQTSTSPSASRSIGSLATSPVSPAANSSSAGRRANPRRRARPPAVRSCRARRAQHREPPLARDDRRRGLAHLRHRQART